MGQILALISKKQGMKLKIFSLLKIASTLYHDPNAFVLCIDDVDILWYHCLLNAIRIRMCDSPVAACFDQQFGREIKTREQNKT